jgi:hypothetical protein
MRPAISLLVLAMAACSAHGANVTVVATGVMDEFYDPDGMLFFSEPPPGTEFRLTFTYDDEAADLFYDDPGIGVYPWAISSVTFEVGGYAIPNSPALGRYIIVVNDDEGNDAWTAYFDWQNFAPTPGISAAVHMTLTGPTGVFDSDSLVPPLWPHMWESGVISYSATLGTGEDQFITLASTSASIQSVTTVPLPAGAWLLASGLGLLGWRARRQRVSPPPL